MIVEEVVRLPVALVDDAVEVIQPLADPAIDEALGAIQILSLMPLRVRVPFDRIPDDVALGLRVEVVIANGQGILGRFWCSNRDGLDAGVYHVFGERALTSLVREPQQDWHLIIAGDRDMAMRDLSRSRYWAGTIRLRSEQVPAQALPPDAR